jgi:hypothetical protein
MRGYNNITDGRSAMKLFTAYSKARLAPSLSCIEEALRAMAILGKPAAADILLQKVTACVEALPHERDMCLTCICGIGMV